MKNYKILVGILFALGLTGNAWAQEAKTAVQADEITFRGEIFEFEAGNIYKMRDVKGNIVRVDLGKDSGRMLNRTPFDVTGKMTADENGPLLAMSHMDYKDPDPFAEYFDALKHNDKNNMSGGLEFEQIRDVAFDHENPVSDNAVFYQNNIKNLTEDDLKAYKLDDVSNFAGMPIGSKVVFKGRAINTVVDREVMHFWDTKNQSINVKMNGAYCPLGQRCFIYGTLQEADGGLIVNLEYMESLELPAEAYE